MHTLLLCDLLHKIDSNKNSLSPVPPTLPPISPVHELGKEKTSKYNTNSVNSKLSKPEVYGSVQF